MSGPVMHYPQTLKRSDERDLCKLLGPRKPPSTGFASCCRGFIPSCGAAFNENRLMTLIQTNFNPVAPFTVGSRRLLLSGRTRLAMLAEPKWFMQHSKRPSPACFQMHARSSGSPAVTSQWPRKALSWVTQQLACSRRMETNNAGKFDHTLANDCSTCDELAQESFPSEKLTTQRVTFCFACSTDRQ